MIHTLYIHKRFGTVEEYMAHNSASQPPYDPDQPVKRWRDESLIRYLGDTRPRPDHVTYTVLGTDGPESITLPWEVAVRVNIPTPSDPPNRSKQPDVFDPVDLSRIPTGWNLKKGAFGWMLEQDATQRPQPGAAFTEYDRLLIERIWAHLTKE